MQNVQDNAVLSGVLGISAAAMSKVSGKTSAEEAVSKKTHQQTTACTPLTPDSYSYGSATPGRRAYVDSPCTYAGVPCPGSSSAESARQLFQAALVADKYLLLDQVEGSSLYRCLNVHTQQELVCKIVTRDCTQLLSAHYRLEAEERVSRLEEVLLGDRGDVYLMFPKAHGDLHSYVRQRRRLREPEARRLFRHIATAVKACHENNIVLRDLKLRKFVFADEQRTELKLESLEDAVVLEGEGEGSDLLTDKRGCPAYVSPEILRANHCYSGRAADMWSLGVILYTMLVGRYPFNDSEHASLFVKISRGQFALPDWMSCKARCLVRSLLRRDPTERLTADDVLYHPWLAQVTNTSNQPSAGDHEIPSHSHFRMLRYSQSHNNHIQNSDQVVPVWTPPENSDEQD